MPPYADTRADSVLPQTTIPEKSGRAVWFQLCYLIMTVSVLCGPYVIGHLVWPVVCSLHERPQVQTRVACSVVAVLLC